MSKIFFKIKNCFKNRRIQSALEDFTIYSGKKILVLLENAIKIPVTINEQWHLNGIFKLDMKNSLLFWKKKKVNFHTNRTGLKVNFLNIIRKKNKILVYK